MQHHHLSFPPEDAELQTVVGLFGALADSTRLLLLLALQSGEQTVGELVGQLGQPQSTVSRHLATLRHAGLVSTRRQGTRVYYRLTDSHLAELLTQAFSHAQHRRLALPDHPVSGRPAGED